MLTRLKLKKSKKKSFTPSLYFDKTLNSAHISTSQNWNATFYGKLAPKRKIRLNPGFTPLIIYFFFEVSFFLTLVFGVLMNDSDIKTLPLTFPMIVESKNGSFFFKKKPLDHQ